MSTRQIVLEVDRVGPRQHVPAPFRQKPKSARPNTQDGQIDGILVGLLSFFKSSLIGCFSTPPNGASSLIGVRCGDEPSSRRTHVEKFSF